MPSQDLQSHLPADETDRGGRRPSGPNPTLLYGGGRNAPLTLAKATVVKQIMTTQVKDLSVDLSQLPSSVVHKAGSVYASCHSQDDDLNSSVEEFRSANTSLDEDESHHASSSRSPAVINRLQQRRHGDSNDDGDLMLAKSTSHSTESNSSPE
jgi:hypothetical protein